MKTLEFTQNLELDETKQLSTQLARQFTPLYLTKDMDETERINLITFYLNWYNLISKQGEHEHSSDWDPAITVELYDGTKLGDEPGFDTAQINDAAGNTHNTLLIEHPNEDGESPNENEDCYYTVRIMDISSISYTFH